MITQKQRSMKRYFFIILAVAAASCSKNMEVESPSFQVSLDPARLVADTFTYRLGDTTRFRFTGSVGNVAFYSGETGKRYSNRTATKALGTVNFSFSSKAEWGAQVNTLQVLATNKLPGYDSASVVNAAWTDITSRAKLATNATVVASGTINLTDLVQGADDSLFIALKYSGVTGTTQRTWTITNWRVENALLGQTITLSTFADDVAYWTRYGSVYAPTSGRWTPSASDLKITGGDGNAATNTSWVMSKALYVGRIPPDVSVGVKSINEPDKKEYTYVYPATGIYKATFVAFNHTLDEQKSVVRELVIKVIP